MNDLTFQNEAGVKKIHFVTQQVSNYCPLGKDWCTYVAHIDLKPGGFCLTMKFLGSG